MTIAKRGEDVLLKAPTVAGVRMHADLIRNECLVTVIKNLKLPQVCLLTWLWF